MAADSTAGPGFPLDVFLRDDHPLRSDRETRHIARRFCLTGTPGTPLEDRRPAPGSTKERVRRAQATALDKLRKS